MLSNIGSVYLLQCAHHRSPIAGFFRPFSSSKPTDPKLATHYPNLVDKYVLVWLKKYPSVKDVPTRVTQHEIEKVRNWARIKICIYLCIATAFASLYAIKLGKDAAKRGESVKKMNLDWHKAQKEK